MTDREQTPPLDCKCLTWCRDYGIGRHTERHHRVCPKWYEYLGTAYRTRTELIVTGNPGDDENHNCDAMGCSSVSHVLLRLPLASDPAAHVSGAQGDGGTGGVALPAEAQPTGQQYNVANRLLDMLMREAHGTSTWPGNWMAVREQLLGAIRAAGVKAWPQAGTWEHACSHSTAETTLLRAGEKCSLCGAVDPFGEAPVEAPSSREVMQMALDALETALAGLEWYRDRCPGDVNGSDDEADEKIGAAMGALVGALGVDLPDGAQQK